MSAAADDVRVSPVDRDLVLAAEREIAAILSRLETATGTIVRRVWLQDVDVTTMQSARPLVLRSVVVEYERLPGTSWQV